MDAKSSNKTATLTVGNKTYDFPILSGTVGPDVIDIAKLYAQAGMFTYDPGFTSTGSCQSKITYIDGDAGILEYRGYPIEQLAEKGDFLETCYLLLYGELPTPAQKKDFDNRVIHHTMVHEQMARFFQGFRRDAHPMAIMVAAVGALAAFYHDSTDINDPQQRMIASMRMIAKVPTLAAMAFKYTIGQPFMYPKNSLSFAENFLHMCFAVPCEDYKINPVLADALDKIFILHADHEQNASTSTVRIAGSSGANPFACIAAGIACLWGPAHGGANEAALAMLADIGTVDKIPEFIAKVKDKNSEVRLMGFGHRVYKNYDPRAKIMQKMCHAVLAETGHGDDPMLKVALELEKIALSDQYFIDRKLYPNVDFYSGITLKAMGFPTSMFTVLFAVARTVGWISQWSEMIEDPQQKIGRPRQLYTGVAPPRLRGDGQAEVSAASHHSDQKAGCDRRVRLFFCRMRRASNSSPSATSVDGMSLRSHSIQSNFAGGTMLTGNCLCGSVAYEVDAEPGTIVHCHCRTCRKTHGSAFSTVTNVPRDRFRWIRGEDLLRGFEFLARQDAVFLHPMRLAYRRRARRQGHHPASDGLSRYADRRSPQDAHLAIGWRVVVRPEGSIAGVAGRYAAEGSDS